MKQIAVLGLGMFGMNVARMLEKSKHEVMGVDFNAAVVEDAADELTHVVQADILNEASLEALGLRNFDVVVLSVGALQTSIMGMMLIKDAGASYIVARATSDMHARILQQMGANEVVFPERDMGFRVGNRIASNSVLESIELSKRLSLFELKVPAEWVGQDLKHLAVRPKYGINVVSISRGGNIILSPTGDDVLLEGYILIVIGPNESVAQFSNPE